MHHLTLAQQMLLIGGMALVTFAIRYPLFALSGRIQLSQPVMAALRYVPPVVLTAIVVPAVLMPSGSGAPQIGLTNPYLVGALVAAIVGQRSQNLLLTIVLGMAGFWAWQGLLRTGWLS